MTVDQQFLGRVLLTVSCGLGGWHCWCKRSELHTLGTWLSQTFAWIRSSTLLGSGAADQAADDVVVRKRMEELRVQHAYHGLEFLSAFAAVVLGAISILCVFVTDPDFLAGYLEAGFGVAVTYVLFLCVSCGYVELSAFRINVFYAVLHALLFLRMFSGGLRYYSITQGGRTLLRALMGLLVLDTRISGAVNCTWTVLSLYQLCVQSTAASLSDKHDIIVGVLVELGTLVVMQFLLWAAEAFVESHVSQNVGMLIARSAQQAMRSLLAAMCDAEITLTPSLEIREPSLKVAYMLAPDQATAEESALDGRTLIDFIAESDQGRFQSFLDSHARSDSAGPAASIQVSLCDTAGRCFAVEILEADLQELDGSGQSGYLIGIRESDTTSKEVPVTSRAGAVGDLREGFPGSSSSSSQLPMGSFNAGCPPVGLMNQDFNLPRDTDASSVGTSPSARSVQSALQQISLPELSQIEVRFDPLGKDMTIKELRCTFKSNVEESESPPMLLDWIHDSMREKLKEWVQDGMNAYFNGKDHKPHGPVLLQWPSRSGNSEEDVMLMANDVVLDVVESDDEDSEEDEDEEQTEKDDDEILGVLRMNCFKQLSYRRGYHRRRHKRNGGGAGSVRSYGGGALKQLPAIMEANRKESEAHEKESMSSSRARGSGGSKTESQKDTKICEEDGSEK